MVDDDGSDNDGETDGDGNVCEKDGKVGVFG
jgi:hypothetical protein